MLRKLRIEAPLREHRGVRHVLTAERWEYKSPAPLWSQQHERELHREEQSGKRVCCPHSLCDISNCRNNQFN